MSKFNRPTVRASGQSPITTTGSATTHEGAPAFARDLKGELFLLAVSNMVGQDTFYEKASDRDDRYRNLVREAAVKDFDWTARMLVWLRKHGNMRSAPIVGALEAVKARLDANLSAAVRVNRNTTVPYTVLPLDEVTSRTLIAEVMQRADEPGEALAYWLSHYGRSIPMPVKRGIADAARRLYTERTVLKYDTASHGVRFADVLELCHVRAGTPEQNSLFKFIVDRRHDHTDELPDLPVIVSNAWLRNHGSLAEWLDADWLRRAGMTWEDTLSHVGSDVDKKQVWEAIIPSMGYMARLRNLRNFDDAGVSDETAEGIAKFLADPDQVARSRQFPYRFLSAYTAAQAARWHAPLEKALTYSVQNIPELPGQSLVLIDTSASMSGAFGGYRANTSKMTPAQQAALFGIALAVKNANRVNVFGFADGVFSHDVRPHTSVLRQCEAFTRRVGEVGHGTEIGHSVRTTFKSGVHNRVFIISDMQTMDDVRTVPVDVPIYGFNLSGYAPTVIESAKPNRHEFGGLTDATFRMVPLIEAGTRAEWPF